MLPLLGEYREDLEGYVDELKQRVGFYQRLCSGSNPTVVPALD